MTTGIVNSQQAAVARAPAAAVNPAGTPPAASAPAQQNTTPAPSPEGQQNPGILRSGERIGTSAAALQDPNSKTYYHQVPGARFIMPDGLEIVFMGGQFTSNAPDVIAELDKVANRPSSLIFTSKVGVAGVTAAEHQLALDAAKNAHTDKP